MSASIIDRVRKLLALAANEAATPAEAALAASKAAELMEAYRISRLDLEARGEAREECIGIEELIALARTCGWRGPLSAAIGKATSCRTWWRSCWNAETRRSEWVLLCAGRESDRIAALYLWVYLLAEIERLTASAVAENPAYRSSRSWKESFRSGAVSAIASKLRERTPGERPANVAALVRVADAKMDDFMQENAPNLRNARRRQRLDGAAWGSGHAAGKGVDVSRNDRRVGAARSLPAAS